MTHQQTMPHAAHFGHAADPEIARRLEAGVRMARSAGAITLGYFQSDRFQIDTKLDGTDVTTADREAEQHLRGEILRLFPDDAILGEEFGEHAGPSGYRWILDPIDGTASFVCGVPLYGTLIGIERGQRVVGGVTHMPALDEMVYAGEGGGAWHVSRSGAITRARVSGVRELSRSVVCTTATDYFAKYGRTDLFLTLASSCAKFRGWSDCYSHVLVATGRVEAVVEPSIKVWDVAAARIIMQEAGGLYTDFAGEDSVYSGHALLSNGHVHAELLKVIGHGTRTE